LTVNIDHNLQEQGQQNIHHLNNLNRHEEVLGFEKILFLAPDDLYERVILILLFDALFQLIEGYAGHDVNHDR
jgi:hypothetical protein